MPPAGCRQRVAQEAAFPLDRRSWWRWGPACPAPKVARKICVRNVIRPCDVRHRGKDLPAATLPTMQLTGVEAVMPRSISQLLIGATVAIGFAVVGVTALGTAVAQSPFEQTKSTASPGSSTHSHVRRKSNEPA